MDHSGSSTLDAPLAAHNKPDSIHTSRCHISTDTIRSARKIRLQQILAVQSCPDGFMNQPATLGALAALIVGAVISFQAILAARISLADNAASTATGHAYVAGGLIAISLLVFFTYTGQLTLAPLGWQRILQMPAWLVSPESSSLPALPLLLPKSTRLAPLHLLYLVKWRLLYSPTIWAQPDNRLRRLIGGKIAGLTLFAVSIWLLITPGKD